MSAQIDPVLADFLSTQPAPVFDDNLDLPAERKREREAGLAAPRLAEPETVTDRSVPGPTGAPDIPVRVYRPATAEATPLTLYLHGGGFVVGSVDTHDNITRLLAEQAGTTVVSVDYRLAPEHRYPAAVEDALAAYRWVVDNAATLGGDPHRVAVAGDSAGGLLAAALGHLAVERGLPVPFFQLLLYPSTGAGASSADQPADGDYGMSQVERDWYQRAFFGDASPADLPAHTRPARVRDLSGQPPAFILTAELDPIRGEGEYYAQRLRDCGVAAEWQDSPGMVHSFLRYMHAVPAARQAAQPAFDALRRAFRAE
ncbi:acetyl esterase [Haloactinospora alba]|uniref:Acetyl esterase n=1 Tax=Haloactinospora alba TaxID=405555 RepID=A0A543NKY1_9ACTN|nr:alpha/beta hydrolase [Haloactinospora alba]TQN32464.1 acetyl esterase [Haloactinospora alba]